MLCIICGDPGDGVMMWCILLWKSLCAGIVKPIEAKLRKGKGAVGAYGNERTQQSLQDFPVVDSEEEEEKVSQN